MNPVHGQARFGGAGFVIEAGVQDAAVMAGLMGAEAIFFLQDGHATGRQAPAQFESRGQTDDSAADDDDAF